jgi:hypothetical protein
MAGIMSERLATLRKRFLDAKADVDASKREIRQASAKKLAELKAQKDPMKQLAGLKDPALTLIDREQLEQAIANHLPRRRFRVPRSLTDVMNSCLRQARYHWRGLVLTGLISIPVVTIGWIASSNTGQSMGQYSNNYDITWQFPDGHSEIIPVAAKSAAVVIGRLQNGDYRLRYWSAGDGYGVAIVSAGALSRITKPSSE